MVSYYNDIIFVDVIDNPHHKYTIMTQASNSTPQHPLIGANTMHDYVTEVTFVDGTIVKESIVTTSLASAKRAARKLAILRRPDLGTPTSVSAWMLSPNHWMGD